MVLAFTVRYAREYDIYRLANYQVIGLVVANAIGPVLGIYERLSLTGGRDSPLHCLERVLPHLVVSLSFETDIIGQRVGESLCVGSNKNIGEILCTQVEITAEVIILANH